jgi:hydroxyethylthiazole kinase-like uncharacterized protein yjeF
LRAIGDLLAAHPLPGTNGSKDERGTLLIVGGPPSCPGAVLLAATGALRSGSGRVQLVVDPAVAAAAAVTVPETLVLGWDQRGPMPPDVEDRVAAADAVLIGSGHTEDVSAAVMQVAATLDDASLILDARALDVADRVPAGGLVLAPNVDEAERLAGDGGGDGDEAELVARLVDRYGRAVAVRGERTVVGDSTARWLLEGAPDGLGTPGSGDVLMGILGGLLARRLPAVAALGWAVAIHATAGHQLAETHPLGFTASDVADRLPFAASALILGERRRSTS